MKKYIAEFIGTFFLTVSVAFSLTGEWPVPTVLVAGLVLAIGVYVFGRVSGAHLNPAITLGSLMLKKTTNREAGMYILSQLLGALLAMVVARTYVGVSSVLSLFVLPESPAPIIISELVGTFFFALGGAAVILGKVPEWVKGFVMGGSLIIGSLIAFSFGSLGVLNPAVAIGLGFINPIYVLAPIIGSIAGMYSYNVIASAKTSTRRK